MSNHSPLSRVRHTLVNDTWVKPYLKSYRKVLLTALALGVLALICAAALMFTSGYLISASATQPPEGIFALFTALAFVQIFGVAKPFLGYIERLTSHDWVLRMTSSLRSKLFDSLSADSRVLTAPRRVGDLLGVLDQDIGHAQNLYLRSLFPLIIAWALWIIEVVALGFFSVWFALGMLLLVGISTVLMPLVSIAVNGARVMRDKQLKSERYAAVTDDVLGVADWRFAGRGDDYLKRITSTQEQLRANKRATARFSRMRDLIQGVVLGIIPALLLIAFGWYLGAGDATGMPAARSIADPVNWIAAFAIVFFPLIEAFDPCSAAAEDALTQVDAIERLNTYDHRAAQATHQAAPACAHPDIRISNLKFGYNQTDTLFEGFDLHIPAGQHVAVLGPSGTGKSTLLSLIHGDVAPTVGSVKIGTQDATAFGEAICAQVGVVSQETYLFNMTLRDNVRIGRPAATDEEVTRALVQVGLEGLLGRLPEGLSTMVDEEGLRFSGGERHRIALARILVQDAPIVLLDEPATGLDPITEAQLMRTTFDVLAQRTVVMVTHHLLGVRQVHRVIFLEQGSIALDGSVDTLQNTSERFRKLMAFDQGL